MIAMVFTGGTISMRVDAVAGGAVPALDARDILASARGIEDVAELRVEDWGRFPGPHMDVDRMWALRARVLELVAEDGVDGIVITHGTDTIEETAYLIARSVVTSKPIVFTGAMRNLSELGWDGPSNLVDAVRVAAHPEARAYGVLLVMNGRAFSALDVTKAHTHVLDAFESPGLGPVAEVDDEAVIFRRALSVQRAVLSPESLATPVDIVGAWAGADARLLDALLPTARGLVVSALGRGNVPPLMADALAKWRDAGTPVVITSRTGRGRVGQTYGYPGGGRRLGELGAIFAGSQRPVQARIEREQRHEDQIGHNARRIGVGLIEAHRPGNEFVARCPAQKAHRRTAPGDMRKRNHQPARGAPVDRRPRVDLAADRQISSDDLGVVEPGIDIFGQRDRTRQARVRRERTESGGTRRLGGHAQVGLGHQSIRCESAVGGTAVAVCPFIL